MAKASLPLFPWFGGYSTDNKYGPKHSFAYGAKFDFRKSPSKLSVLPKTAKESGSTVTDLPVGMVRVANGDFYFVGDTGNFYKRTAAGVWSSIGNVGSASGYGIVYRRDQDIIYITKQTEVATYGPVSGTPTLTNSKYAASRDQFLTGGALNYVVGTSINEGAAHRQTWTPEVEPLYSIKLYILNKGTTADWTVTVHDDANNTICTSTVSNASLTINQLNEFVMATPGRLLVKPNARTYHFHVTVSNTTGAPQAQVGTVFDLETADFETYASRLVQPNNGMHPAILFQQYLCVVNERYLSVFEPLQDTPSNAEWQRHRLTFPPGYEGTSVAVLDEFLAIGCEQLTSTGENAGSGKIFFWDGAATTYNFFVDVPQGAPYSLFQDKGVLEYIAAGALYGLPGVNAQPVKLRQLPYTDQEFTTYDKNPILYPQMLTVRNSVLLIGFPSYTANQNIEHGVYSWGARDKDYPTSFGFSYPINTGTLYNTSGNLRIGMVQAYDPKLFIGWRDGSSYGVDVVDTSSQPFASAEMESLIFDAGRADKPKMAIKRVMTFETLPSGATVTLKYKIDRASSWNTITVQAVAGDTRVELPINSRFYEIQFRTEVTAGATTPYITSDIFIFDDLKSEGD